MVTKIWDSALNNKIIVGSMAKEVDRHRVRQNISYLVTGKKNKFLAALSVYLVYKLLFMFLLAEWWMSNYYLIIIALSHKDVTFRRGPWC